MTEALCTSATVDGFATRLLADTDCQAYGMVERGYAALAQPGGAVSLALTGLMVIAVAFFGYRLLVGRGLRLSDAVGLTVKLGVVLLLATSWESWQALAYNGVARAPTEIAGEMLVGIGAPPPLQRLETTLNQLTDAAVGYRSRAGIASPLVGGPAAAAAVLNVSAILLTLSTVGILVAAKVVLAILLAIAPAMAGFILFDGTRGMAQGWLAAIAAVAIAPAFALLVAAVEFAILAPIIARVLAEQAAGDFFNGSVMPIGLVSIVFVIALIFALRAAAQIGTGLLHRQRPVSHAMVPEMPLGGVVSERHLMLPSPAATPGAARALESLARRDARPAAATPRSHGIAVIRASSAARDSGRAAAPARNENIVTFDRRSSSVRAVSRRSRAAARRDS